MSDLGLEPLLAALREAGLRAGVAELLRLREVFARAPNLADPAEGGRERLRSALRAVLVKSCDERTTFDRIFDAWSERAEREWSARSVLSRNPTVDRSFLVGRSLAADSRPAVDRALAADRGLAADRSLAGSRSRRRRLVWPAAAVVILLLLFLLLLRIVLGPDTIWSPRPEPTPAPDHAKPRIPEPVTGGKPAPAATETVTPSEPVWQGWPALGLGLLALATASGLWLALRRRNWLPVPEPLPSREGPPRVFLTPVPLAGLQLLDARQEEALVWGIGHFVAEEPTRSLDAAATVRATAREAGITRLIFHRARYHREVWLWVDEAADDPTLLLLADEVEASLVAHGLPVARAMFHGLPERWDPLESTCRHASLSIL